MSATATATATKESANGLRASQAGQPQTQNLPAIQGPRLPYHPMIQERFGIDKASWKALVEAIFPMAQSVESVILALSYCRARKLDPFKRNVHIVPIWNSDLRKNVDTIWPGIGELRTTAFRTGQYAGRGDTMFGPDKTETFKGDIGRTGSERQIEKTITFPEWAQVTVKRMVQGQLVDFVGPRVYWIETYATMGKSDVPNDMWSSRPRGQLDKCAEAAALRAAFPEEVGCEYIPEEVQNQRANAIETTATSHKPGDALESLTRKLAGKDADTAPTNDAAGEADLAPDYAGESVSPEEEAALLFDANLDDAIAEAVKNLAWSPPNATGKLAAFVKSKFGLSKLDDCSAEQKQEVLTWLEGQLEK